MNWIRENKFLTGFIAVMVICTGVLGYFLYTAWGAYDDVTDTYTEQASALHQLQTRIPYPDETNLAKYKQEQGDFVDATHDLATNLAAMTLPVEDLTPSAFQDRLRDTVSSVLADAAKAGVKLPDHFYMDFDKYQTSPPASAEVAAQLGRQLAALKLAVEIAINEHVDSISKLQRIPLPQEGGAEGGHSGGPGGGGFGGGGFGGGPGGRRAAGGGGNGLVEKFPFDLEFVSSQPVFQKVLNDFAASSKQFFITRTLLVENTNPKPIAKDSATPAPPATTGTDAGAGAAPDNTSGRLTFLVGTEKLDVAMRIDIVAFNPPAKSARGGAAPH
jgi:uncharacterized membrane protein YgcG